MYRAIVPLLCLTLAACHSAQVPASSQEQQRQTSLPPPLRLIQTVPRGLAPGDAQTMRAAEMLPPDAGAFAKCAACHALTTGTHGIGPSLKGVYGRPAARAPGYRYSTALTQAGLVWDAATLDAFLTRPSEHVPGNKMTFAGLRDPAQRAQIIALMERYTN